MLTIETIAMLCHEANRAYCQSIGDYSQVKWCEAADNIKASAIDGVTRILSGEIREPRDSHDSWLAFKISDGWRFGEVKDEKAKTHPCLVDYDDLSEAERIKDYIFFGIVSSMKAFADLEAINV